VARLDLEVDAVELRRAGGRNLLRVYLDGDGPTGSGPTLDQVTTASAAISRALDEAPEVTGEAPYVLEVSSRGVHRPLTTPAHYRRNRGRLLECTPTDGGPSVVGRIVGSDDEGVTLDVDGRPVRRAYGEIRRAIVQVELNRPQHDPAARADDEGEE